MKREVFLVTATDGKTAAGMIITWVSPAGLIPEQKRLMMSLSPANQTTQVLLATGRFVLHLLQKSQASLVPLFGEHSSRTVDKFAEVEYEDKNGQHIIKGTCGWNICRVVSTMESGDRITVLAEVEQEYAEEVQEPLFLRELDGLVGPDVSRRLSEKFQNDIERDRLLRISFQGK
jgi:flavin reductase (DIM6/NTAB) family NADH-FMN oxidoreductase RutF